MLHHYEEFNTSLALMIRAMSAIFKLWILAPPFYREYPYKDLWYHTPIISS